MTADEQRRVEQRKLTIRRHALNALSEYLQRRADGTLGDVDIETLIMYYGRDDNVESYEAWDAIEESLIDAFKL